LAPSRLSVNRTAMKLVDKLCAKPDEYGIIVEKRRNAPTLIDTGIKAKGSFQAGKIITEICLGGLGEVKLYPAQFEDLVLPSVFVHTNHPAVSTMGSQFADWQIKKGDFTAIGSGPARALARKDPRLYETIDYEDESDATVLVLETSTKPPKPVIQEIAEDCRVSASKLSLILVPTTSVAGSTQVSGRIVETGLHKLMKLGLDPKKVTNAFGSAPIAPIHPKFVAAMGRTNDAILYAGTAHYDVFGLSDDELSRIIERAPSSASKAYGLPFQQVFKNSTYDFYKIDANLFAPAVISACNLDTGSVFKAGKTNVEVLKRSINLKTL